MRAPTSSAGTPRLAPSPTTRSGTIDHRGSVVVRRRAIGDQDGGHTRFRVGADHVGRERRHRPGQVAAERDPLPDRIAVPTAASSLPGSITKSRSAPNSRATDPALSLAVVITGFGAQDAGTRRARSLPPPRARRPPARRSGSASSTQTTRDHRACSRAAGRAGARWPRRRGTPPRCRWHRRPRAGRWRRAVVGLGLARPGRGQAGGGGPARRGDGDQPDHGCPPVRSPTGRRPGRWRPGGASRRAAGTAGRPAPGGLRRCSRSPVSRSADRADAIHGSRA